MVLFLGQSILCVAEGLTPRANDRLVSRETRLSQNRGVCGEEKQPPPRA